MGVIALDAFNRIAPDLHAEARWDVDDFPVGQAHWQADGQHATNGTGASEWQGATRGMIFWKGYDTGINYPGVYAEYRPHEHQDEWGVFCRSRLDAANAYRIALVYSRSLARWEVRYYYNSNNYNIVGVPLLDSVSGYAPDETSFNTMAIIVKPDNCLTNPNSCPAPGALLRVTAFAYPHLVLGNFPWMDPYLLLPGGIDVYRGFGVEALTAAAATYGSPTAPGWEANPPAWPPGVEPHRFYFDNIQVEDWRGADHEASPALVAEPSLAQVTLAGEGEVSKSGSLPYVPDVGERVTQQWFTQRTKTDAGYEITWPRFNSGRKLFEVGHAALTTAEQTVLIAFLEAHAGPEVAFTYTPPSGGAALTCYFLRDSFRFVRHGIDNVRVTYVLEEVLS